MFNQVKAVFNPCVSVLHWWSTNFENISFKSETHEEVLLTGTNFCQIFLTVVFVV